MPKKYLIGVIILTIFVAISLSISGLDSENLNPKISGEWLWLNRNTNSNTFMELQIDGGNVSGTYSSNYNNYEFLNGCGHGPEESNPMEDCGIRGSGTNNKVEVTVIDSYYGLSVSASIVYDPMNDTLKWDIDEASLPTDMEIHQPRHVVFHRSPVSAYPTKDEVVRQRVVEALWRSEAEVPTQRFDSNDSPFEYSFDYPVFDGWTAKANKNEVTYSPPEPINLYVPPRIHLEHIIGTEIRVLFENLQTNRNGVFWTDAGRDAGTGHRTLYFRVEPDSVDAIWYLKIEIRNSISVAGFSEEKIVQMISQSTFFILNQLPMF